jgi:thioredoxin reductase
MTGPAALSPDVLIVGGGPSGLTAAAALAPRIGGQVLVLDREAAAGGIPRHSDHPGYGIRDMKRFMSGPAYARRLVSNALNAGADIHTRTMVTGWADPHTVEVTSPRGRHRVRANAIILATGARERPRPARLIPGDRPAGIYTTGQLQNLVHLHHQAPGTRAVIVGAELVSWSAAMTLREANCRPILMISAYPAPEAYAAFTIHGRLAFKIPVATCTRVTRIVGQGRISAVEIENRDTHTRRTIECDTLVLTGDWIPDNELARTGNLEIDPNTRGPLIDTRQETTTPGVFAIGNLTHPVDTADVAALDGRAVTEHVLAHLRGRSASPTVVRGPRILPGKHLKWIAPGILNPDATPPRDRLLAWPRTHLTLPTVIVIQDGHMLDRRRLPWPASPGRAFRIPSSALAKARSDGGAITIDVD